ncbi:hypothetical protein C8J57DRAFT_1528790 [Mycena rebaudengoi]|nr:hypothetical protein C8J57DRAFT_1528790 [Mycena rebaudengoi]
MPTAQLLQRKYPVRRSPTPDLPPPFKRDDPGAPRTPASAAPTTMPPKASRLISALDEAMASWKPGAVKKRCQGGKNLRVMVWQQDDAPPLTINLLADRQSFVTLADHKLELGKVGVERSDTYEKFTGKGKKARWENTTHCAAQGQEGSDLRRPLHGQLPLDEVTSVPHFVLDLWSARYVTFGPCSRYTVLPLESGPNVVVRLKGKNTAEVPGCYLTR